jgi:glycine/D-amino acid oxidase-like deaminating enzyme
MMDRSIATNVSLWESPYPAMGKKVPPNVSHAQVCVIAAGIAGLTTASLLAKEGRKVLVLEEREIGGGRTSKTTAHLASALDDRFSELERSRGEE